MARIPSVATDAIIAVGYNATIRVFNGGAERPLGSDTLGEHAYV